MKVEKTSLELFNPECEAFVASLSLWHLCLKRLMKRLNNFMLHPRKVRALSIGR